MARPCSRGFAAGLDRRAVGVLVLARTRITRAMGLLCFGGRVEVVAAECVGGAVSVVDIEKAPNPVSRVTFRR